MKYVIFIHGAGKGAYKEDALLAESLQQALGSGYMVKYPKMEDEENPEYPAWENQISSEIQPLQGEVFLVGHSFGGSVLIKYVMEHKKTISIAGLFMIATPFWGVDEFWKWEEGKLPDDVGSKLKGIPIFLYHNRHDEVVPFDHLKHYAEKLPAATVREVKARGHQLENNLKEIADDIKRI